MTFQPVTMPVPWGDETPSPPIIPRIHGLPVGYGGQSQVSIPAPNLTDSSMQGLYHAAIQTPSQIGQLVNQVSSRIGAPTLTAFQKPPMAQQQVFVGPPMARSFERRIPATVRNAMATVRVQVRNLLNRG